MSLLDYLFGSKKQSKEDKIKDFNKMFMRNPNDIREDYFNTGLQQLKKWGSAFLTALSPPMTGQDVVKTVVKSSALDTVEDLLMGRGLRFKYYGKWAGPSYSAGKFYEKNQIITKDDIINNKPIDDLDNLTLQHDLRYQLGATKQTQEQRKQALRYADEEFIRDAEKLLNSKDLDLKQKVATIAAIKAFKIKLSFDTGYNIDKLPEDKIKEAEDVVLNYFNQVNPENLPKQQYEKPSIGLIEQNLENNIDLSENNINISKPQDSYQLTEDEKKFIIDFFNDELEE